MRLGLRSLTTLRRMTRPPVALPDLGGMKTLDRDAFTVRVPCLSVRIPAERVGELRRHPAMRGLLIELPNTAPIVKDVDSAYRQLRLGVERGELKDDVQELFQELGSQLQDDEVTLGYEAWSTSEILSALIPNTPDPPSSFTQTGHIAHVNLRDEYLPYKHLIGQVILDKNPSLRTVVNKLGSIHAEYRYFDMEVIAGEDSEEVFVSTVNESSCSFTLDFRTVYWNSRLAHEHERLVALFQPGEVVADVMGGVGPFAVPAAKKGCRVLGNDLNPESIRWMEVNRINNKVETNLRVTNIDGRAFIQQAPLEAWDRPFPPVRVYKSRKHREREERAARQARASGTVAADVAVPSVTDASPENSIPQEVDHFIMNLPDSALTFLDAYRGSYIALSRRAVERGLTPDTLKMPMIHVHCFTRQTEFQAAELDICERASKHLGHPISSTTPDFHLHMVRSVAPNKEMYCLSFRLPRAVALAE